MKLRLALLLTFLFALSLSFGQTKMAVQESSEVLVHGTSTLHDWTMNCEQFSGSAMITMKDGHPAAMTDLVLEIVVKGMKSGKSAMDSSTYKAMDESKHPKVVFRSTKVTIRPQGAGVTVIAEGKLTIAGVTKTVTLQADGYKSGDRWVFKGKKEIHTPDYDVERVSAMMGTIKTGEDVVIDFDIAF